MIPEQFAWVGALFLVASIASYVRATWIGEAQPNRVTFFMWGVAPFIATAAQMVEHVGLSTILVFLTGLGPTLIFLASFYNKKAYWKSTLFDFLCGFLAIIGLILWQTTQDADYAILFSILSDFIAGIPTLRKSITHPESEDGRSYLLACIGDTIGILTTTQRSFVGYGFVVYLALFTGLLTLIIYRSRIACWIGLGKNKKAAS